MFNVKAMWQLLARKALEVEDFTAWMDSVPDDIDCILSADADQLLQNKNSILILKRANK